MKIRIEKYHFNLSDEAEAQQYAKLCARLKEEKFKKSATLSIQDSQKFRREMPKEQTIEPEFLFNDQLNTDYGRIFDWSEVIYPNEKIKEGYFISEGREGLQQARDEQFVCGYCGKRYHLPEQHFCDACIGNEYLKETELHLLALLPVSSKKDRLKVLEKELSEAWEQAQKELPAKLEAARIKRLNVKANELETKLVTTIQQEKHETEIRCKLLRLGFDTDNLIFYSHKGRWCCGWRNPIAQEEREGLVRFFREKVSPEFASLVDYKTT